MLVEYKRDLMTDAVLPAPEPYDLDKIVSLSLIRDHTKTDDVPSVTDEQLSLYRRAALEAAQSYTGLLLTGRKHITEDVVIPGIYPYRAFFNHATQYQFAESRVYYYGIKSRAPRQVAARVGTNVIRLPADDQDFGMNCCNPNPSAQARIQYIAGYATEADIPSAVALGALKYIAHVIQNAGDNVITTSASGSATGSSEVSASANPALASGALEIWRSAVPDAI